MIDAHLANAVVKVGDGRGFIVQAKHSRFIVTAAHCLPHFPPCHGASYAEERTYANLLGPLNGAEPKIWAECIFADPIADVAVVGGPDGAELYDQYEAYEALTEDRPVLGIGGAPPEGRAWLLSLAGGWQPCIVKHVGDDHPFAVSCPLWIEDAEGGIVGGMSGSPIVNDDGVAIGIVCLGNGPDGATSGGPNPRLVHHLPGWLLR